MEKNAKNVKDAAKIMEEMWVQLSVMISMYLYSNELINVIWFKQRLTHFSYLMLFRIRNFTQEPVLLKEIQAMIDALQVDSKEDKGTFISGKQTMVSWKDLLKMWNNN